MDGVAADGVGAAATGGDDERDEGEERGDRAERIGCTGAGSSWAWNAG